MTQAVAMPIIGALSLCLCVLLAAFLLLVPGPLRRANRLLAGFLLLTGVDVAGWMAPLLPPDVRSLLAFRLPLAFLQMPLLYAYMALLCFSDFRSRRHRLAAMLAVSASALSLAPRAAAVAGLADAPRGGMPADLVFNTIALNVQYYAYAALMLALLLRYRRARRLSGTIETSLAGPWVATMLGVSMAAHGLVLLKGWAWLGGHGQAHARLDLIVGLAALGISVALTLAAMLLQPLFVGLPAPPPARRGAKRPMPDAGGSDALAALDRYMAEHRPFLDPGLTIRTLARRIGIGQRDLSALINQELGVHFFDYVNRHRIDLAAALLADEAHRSATVLEIAHLAGFNTKSSFNAAFARHRGESPSRYRARMLAPADD